MMASPGHFDPALLAAFAACLDPVSALPAAAVAAPA